MKHMSQKDNKFQSKGKKFGGGKPGGGRGFSKRSEGDRDYKPGGRGGSAGGSRGFGDRKPYKKREGDDSRPARSYGGSDRPFKKRFDDRDDRPKRDFGDRPKRSFDDGDKPRRSFRDGDRPFKKRFDDRDDRPKRDFGDRPKRDFGDRPPRKFEDRGDRPKRDFGDRPPRKFDDRKEGGFSRDRKSFGDRPKRSFDDKPRRFEGDKKRSFNARDDKPKRSFDRKREDRPSNERFEASFETKQKLKSDRPSYGAPSAHYLYGVHAVNAALLNPKREIKRLLVTEEGYKSIREAYDDALANGLKIPDPVVLEKEDIERLVPRDSVHQGVVLDCQPLEDVFLIDILNAAKEDTKLLILDQVTDPHNIGAILRSASAFGATAVIVQKLHAPDITGTVAKSACGAVEFVPIVREVNLSRAMEQIKEAGFFCFGLDERGKKTLAQEKPTGKVALVLGAEGDGIRRLVADNCDVLVKLPTFGEISSLNVSNAAAVALYELVRED
jgi:23S rRNA (guanosine2251-2'-O)-methyltransferase